MVSGRGWLAGDWPLTDGVLNITAPAWTAGFHWWRSGNITRTQNVREYMLALDICLLFTVVLSLFKLFSFKGKFITSCKIDYFEPGDLAYRCLPRTSVC